MAVIQGTTASGFSYSIEPEKMNDMRVLDALTDVSEGNPAGLSQLIRLLLTPEEKDELYRVNTLEDGRIDPKGVSKDLFEAINSTRNGKN
jgi:hypothetical protein